MSPSALTIKASVAGDRIELALAGGLDRANSHLVDDLVELHVSSTRSRRVDLDASSITSCAAAGIEALTRSVQVLERFDADWCARTSPAVRLAARRLAGDGPRSQWVNHTVRRGQ